MNSPLKLDLFIQPLAMREPIYIAGRCFTEEPVLRLNLRDARHEGRGEAAGVFYQQDTPEGMLATLEALRPQIEAGLTRASLRELLPPGGARNALDCALWELEARRERRTVWQLAGLPSTRPLRTTFTMGADTPQVMAEQARSFPGASALKLKLTGEVALDCARVRAVRAARPEVWIGVDANQSYTVANIVELLPVLTECRIDLLEQPFARGREQDMRAVRFPLDTAADESCLDLNDLENIAGLFKVVNLKLDKCGGLTEGLMMAARARQLGLKVMVGCMCGTSLSMAPAFVLGQLCDIVDLDMPVFLARDHVPSVRYVGGQIYCPEEVWGGQRGAVSLN